MTDRQYSDARLAGLYDRLFPPAPAVLDFYLPLIVARFLTEAGFVLEAQFGDFDRRPLTPASPEIVTIARATARATRG
jgi:hypothetical protein